MLSAFPAMPPSDGFFGIQFPTFEGGFTPWDFQEPLFAFQQHEAPLLFCEPQEPVMSHSCSENSNPKPVSSNSGSDYSNRKRNSPCSDDPNQPASIIEERKRRRMISNRESARRSRMRKQKHLENLRNQLNRLRIGNRDLTSRLRLAAHHSQRVRSDNDRLQSESALLREKLFAVHQVLLVRELQQFSPSSWPCNNNSTIMPITHENIRS